MFIKRRLTFDFVPAYYNDRYDTSHTSFVKDLENRSLIIEEFDEDIWCYLIDKATVNKDGTVTFLFRNGEEVMVIS